MSINVKVSESTLKDLEDSYLNFKESILEDIHNNFLKDKISLEDLKNSFIRKKKKIIIKKKTKHKINNNDTCNAYIWHKSQKKRCGNCKTNDSDYCSTHVSESKRYYGTINN